MSLKRKAFSYIQTGSHRGFYSRWDAHPIHEGVVFWQYAKDTEKWLDIEAAENTKRNKRKGGSASEDPKLVSNRAKRWYSENTERARANVRKYKQDNPEKSRDWNRKHKANRKGAIVPLTDDEAKMVKCFSETCDRLNDIFGGKYFQIDHTVPIANGGKHEPFNLQVVPASWNMSKQSRHSERWEVPHQLT